jgi:hypothetical protein
MTGIIEDPKALPDGVVDESIAPEDMDLPEAVEVELEEGDLAGGDGTEGIADEADRPKREPKAKKRIAKLTAEREELREQAEREREARTTAERRVAAAEAARYRSDYTAVGYRVKALKTDLDAAKRSYQDAVEKGDAGAQTDAQVLITELTGNISEAERWLAANPKPDERRAPPAADKPQGRQQPREQPVEYSREVKSWIADNTWFDPKSPEFDPDLRKEASTYADLLERRLIRQGQRDKIGSAEYFEQIDKHMRTEFPDVFGEDDEDDEPAPPPARKPIAMRAGGSPVAPASRGAVAPGAARPTGNKVTLSAEERQIAESLGSAMRKPGGGTYTPAELHKIYAINKLKQQRTAR